MQVQCRYEKSHALRKKGYKVSVPQGYSREWALPATAWSPVCYAHLVTKIHSYYYLMENPSGPFLHQQIPDHTAAEA